jgi:tetratricopeptide (TPR) repeat protein
MSDRSLAREGLWLAVVLTVALGLRVAYLFERQAQPDFGHPEIDAAYHDDWARTLVYGEARSDEWRRSDRGQPLGDEPYLRPPGYPWFLAAVYALGGGSPTAAVVANQALGLLSVLLAFLIARRAAGGAAGLLAASVLGLHWAGIFFEGELHAPALLGALELAMVWALLRAGGSGSGRSPLGWACLAGVLLGAGALVRPNVLAFLPVVLVWLAWTRRRRGAPWRSAVGATLLGAVLAIAPATVRNYSVSGEFVPITANLGINLYLGNHPGADGRISSDLGELGQFKTCYDYPAVVARLEEQEGRELGLSDVSAYFGDKAWSWIGANFGEFIALTFTKARLLAGPDEIGHNKEVSLEKRGSRVLRYLPFPFPLLIGLALCGLLLGLGSRESEDHVARGRRREALVLLGVLALVFAASLLPFFAAARYRVPIVPLVAPLVGMLATWRGAARGRLAWTAAVGALLAALAWSASGPQVLGAKYHLDRAQGFFAAQDYGRCREEYGLALEALPGTPGAHYGLAVLEQTLGDSRAARQQYELALRSDPRHALSNFNLGFLLRDSGDTEGALARWRIATEADPLLAQAPFQRGTLLAGLGRHREAREDLERAVLRGRGGPGAAQYISTLALLLSASKDPGVRDGEHALALADEALELAPGAAPVLEARAAALAELGRFPAAARTAGEALESASPGLRPRIQSARSGYQAGRPMRM